jgi:uncharacterized membrane protein YdbT with pleckstrin-like domain
LPGPPGRATVRDMAFPRRLLVEGEELVLDLRPHWIALVAPVVVAALALIAVAVASAKWDGVAVWVVMLAALVLIVGYSARKAVDWGTSHFVVTSDRVLHRSGLVAKHSMEIPLEHINDVRFSQNVLERMINAGTLVIQSASEQGREVFENIRHPEEVQKTIYKIGEENKTRMYQGPSAGQQRTAPSVTTELERLADLRAKGILTEEEFQAQKAKVLGN